MTAGPGIGGDPTVGDPLVDEVALMGRVAAEQMDAFETLYRLYHPRLTRFLMGMTHRPALVEEILDDTMLVVWRRAHTYDPEAKVSTWIFGIAYRQALKALRQSGDGPTPAELDDSPLTSTQPAPDLELHQRDLHAMLDHAMRALSAEQRAVIELTYYLGYACREIAAIMDCPVDTVKTRMFYARRRLKALLGAKREEAM
ncbi:sigma-70 family RNA polymerase sigma factor [Lysobacter sp. LF1]|uniref:Sigma-70 family RNA polymerase sigma factor n=1 Tax=Lysobacter stagni TaxID=3045172 RepID=A0ABT6XE46_9GAMM|nr:sigma-70 family RNA polymerase sigma factor [Lysobacter sp. LF1]MDI9238406.1 sigma-70 family RNA polymerase sigma factor [Lysobacter sp. LF1]